MMFLFDWKADRVAPGRLCRCRPVRWEDLRHMARWPRSDDPQEAPYTDFPRDMASLETWYRSCTDTDAKRTWTVLDERDQIVGRIGIALVDEVRKEGLLSIRLRADRVRMGYGFDSLTCVLDHWFGTLEMETMTLDVSILNVGAIKLYEKLGFHINGCHWVPIARRHMVPGTSEAGFVRYLDMGLEREEWLTRKNAISRTAR
ncbi:MAG TPA: GNAT family N-acetyltransferase [bacterium]|nr:GNAT family N-acetyltransferase [bacterium]